MIDFLVLAGLFLASFLLSTLLIRLGIPLLRAEGERRAPLPESVSTRPFDLRSVGLWIGFFETLLVFAFVCVREYSALAIIIGAKEFVRKEQIQKNPAFYLLGTLVNVSMAVLFGLLAVSLLSI